MIKFNSQPQSPMDAIIFDCDSTLTTVEGIDVIAEHNGVGTEVSAMTAEAMSHTGMNVNLYEQRLKLVNPLQEQVLALGNEYFSNKVEDAVEVIQLLKRLNKSVYMVTAGLFPAVKVFGELMGIPDQNIFAVSIEFDSQGKYLDFDHTSPLVTAKGKQEVVATLKQKHKELVFVGDGLSDYETYKLVSRFIGYGGAVYRKNVADLCEHYVSASSFAALLPLILTADEYERLSTSEKKLFDKGIGLSSLAIAQDDK